MELRSYAVEKGGKRVMWGYEKRLQYPVNIKNPDAKAAKIIISQYGGPDGELGASLRYLSQRFAMPDDRVAGLLTDIGIEVLFCSSKNLCKTITMQRVFYSG